MSAVRILAALSLAGAVASPAVADDDRNPTPVEREAIERVLRTGVRPLGRYRAGQRGLGSRRRAHGGRPEYDLILRPGSLEILRRDAETDD